METGVGDFVDDIVVAWERERPGLDMTHVAIEARILRLARFLQAHAEDVLEDDLSQGELNVLAALRRAGPPYTLTPTELTRSLLLSSGAMTNRLDRLEERDLVEREPCRDDRRKVLIHLTDHGMARVDEALDRLVASLASPLAGLEEGEHEVLSRLLAKVLRHLETTEA